MSLNLLYQVTVTDSQDQKTTILTCQNEAGDTVEVEIDPIELFENMIENCFDPDRANDDDLDTSILDAMNDFLSDTVGYLWAARNPT